MKLFGTDGIRGVSGQEPLTPESVERIGRAVGSLLWDRPEILGAEQGRKARRVLLLRDTRESGAWMEERLTAGLLSAGATVIRAGVLATPAASFLVRKHRLDLGVVISASHNPPEHNGVKFVSASGLKVSDEAERCIEEAVSSNRFPARPRGDDLRAPRWREDYIEFLRASGGSLSGLVIVVDEAHGAAGTTAAELFRSLGAKVVEMFGEPCGGKINVGCGAVAPERMAEQVRKTRAHAGVSFDGDADRAVFADETGRIVDGDQVLEMMANAIHPRVVVGTVLSNGALEAYLAKRGIQFVRTPVGDRYVVDAMLREGAELGGEPSGHTVFLEDLPTGDGQLTAVKVFARMKQSGRPLSELANLRLWPQRTLSVPVLHKPPLESLPMVQKALQEVKARLGTRGRVVLRYSGTEPVCRVMVEATAESLADSAARRLAASVREAVGVR